MKKLFTVFSIFILLYGFNPNKSYSEQNNVLLEYCTGTWCQWCPCGHEIIHDILLNYPNTVVLGYHGAGSDPWLAYSLGVINTFGFSSYPTGVIGRKTGIVDRNAWNNEAVLQTLLIQPNVNITISNKSYNAVTRTVTATVEITALANITGDYYVNYVLTENNLIYSQTGNSSCTGSSNYVHGHVVKSMMNGDLGELIHSGSWTSGEMVTRNINYVVPSSPQVSVPDNCELNIFVYKQGTSIHTNSNVQQAMKTSLTGATGIVNHNTVPESYSLSQNYPNPFNPSTNFSFSIPGTEKVSLKIYDVLGNEVETVVNDVLSAGTYSVELNASNYSSGIYFYTLSTGNFRETKKMNLIK